MSDDKIQKILYVFIASGVSLCCLMLTMPILILSFRHSGGFIDQVVSRRIAYCAWRDPLLAGTDFPVSRLAVIITCLTCWAPAALAIGVSLRIGYPKWYIPVFVVTTCIAGTLLFAPQFLAHYHYREPSTEYFVRNISVSVVFSAVMVGMVFLRRLRMAKERPRKILLVCSYLWMFVAFHCVASFFYIFNCFGKVE
jgi:hypothetical protein